VDDLQRLGGEIAERLAGMPPGAAAFRFDASTAPALPRAATSGSIVIGRGYHDYNGCWRADALHLYATKPALRAFGIIVLASLFAQPASVTDIALTHPSTDIRTLRLKTPVEVADTSLGLGHALSCDYRSRERSRFPWADEHIKPADLPAVYLTDADELGGANDMQWLARDTVVGFGGREGVARFGRLLLDIADPANTGDEFHLEGEAGNRGVAPLSAELNIWLPGSFAWRPELGLD
jgi:hypothetical protein